jgi:colicin import membrane protein
MHVFKFSFLFSVIAGSSLAFASPADNSTATQIQPEKIAVSSTNSPMASANAYPAQYRREQEHKIAEAKRLAEATAAKDAEAKTIASPVTRAISLKILRNWQAPEKTTGQKSHTRITLTPSGSIQSIVIRNTPNQEFKDSIEKAIRSAAPFELPENPDARRESQVIYMSFHSK